MPQPRKQAPVVIAIDGTSASGKSTNSRLVAQALGFIHVDTGAMYRTLAWYCLRHQIDVRNARAVAAACRRWKCSAPSPCSASSCRRRSSAPPAAEK